MIIYDLVLHKMMNTKNTMVVREVETYPIEFVFNVGLSVPIYVILNSV